MCVCIAFSNRPRSVNISQTRITFLFCSTTFFPIWFATSSTLFDQRIPELWFGIEHFVNNKNFYKRDICQNLFSYWGKISSVIFFFPGLEFFFYYARRTTIFIHRRETYGVVAVKTFALYRSSIVIGRLVQPPLCETNESNFFERFFVASHTNDRLHCTENCCDYRGKLCFSCGKCAIINIFGDLRKFLEKWCRPITAQL